MRDYSGLSDLSVPAWTLAWVCLRPGGRVAYVANENATNRRHGALLAEFRRRFLCPLLTVEPVDRAWFPGGRVPAALHLCSARSDAEVESSRADDPPAFRIVLDADPTLRGVRRLVEALAGFVPGRDEPPVGRGWHVHAAPPAGPRETLRTRAGGSGPMPPDVEAIVGRVVTDPLVDHGVRVHQRLRTGCNPFFYLRRVDADRVRADPRLGGVELRTADGLFSPVLRRQRELRGPTLDAGALEWVAFVSGPRIRSRELRDLRRFPATVREAWPARGLEALPPDVEAFVDRAEHTSLVVEGRAISIPELSAVRTNARVPRPTSRLAGDPVEHVGRGVARMQRHGDGRGCPQARGGARADAWSPQARRGRLARARAAQPTAGRGRPAGADGGRDRPRPRRKPEVARSTGGVGRRAPPDPTRPGPACFQRAPSVVDHARRSTPPVPRGRCESGRSIDILTADGDHRGSARRR